MRIDYTEEIKETTNKLGSQSHKSNIMDSKLKLKKRKRRFPPDPGRPNTMNYIEASKNPTWKNEKRWASKVDKSLMTDPIAPTDFWSCWYYLSIYM